MLRINNVHKFYKSGEKKLHILEDINLEVNPGDFLAIVGPSGAGKSTLLHVIGGLEKPEGGEVLFDKKSLYGFSDPLLAKLRNEKFGFIFQFYHLLPEFTALENVMLPGFISGKYKKSYLLKRGRDILSSVGLDKRLAHFPSQLSGGEQQRVAIARAMILEPDILLCDEPTGNLDSVMSNRIYNLLLDLNKNKKQTIILVTHQRDITAFAQKKLFIKDGRLSNEAQTYAM